MGFKNEYRRLNSTNRAATRGNKSIKLQQNDRANHNTMVSVGLWYLQIPTVQK